MKTKILNCIVLMLLINHPVFAHDIADIRQPINLALFNNSVGEACSVVLKGNIFDRDRVISKKIHFDRFVTWACGIEFESYQQMKRSGIDLGINTDDFGLDFGTSSAGQEFKQKKRAWCNLMTNISTSDVYYKRYSETISSAMVGAFKTCVDSQKEVLLGKFGAYAYAIPDNSNLESFSVPIEFKARPDKKNEIRGLNASKAVICERNQMKITWPIIMPDTNTIALTCYKPGDQEYTLSFETNMDQTPVIRLPGRMKSDLSVIRMDILDNHKSIQQTNHRINDITRGSRPEKCAWTGWVCNQNTCADGQYMAGIQYNPYTECFGVGNDYDEPQRSLYCCNF